MCAGNFCYTEMRERRRSGTDKEKGMKCSETCVLGSSTESSFSCVASSRPTWHSTLYLWRHKLESVQRLTAKDNVTCCCLLSCISREFISALTTELNRTTGKVDYIVWCRADTNMVNCVSSFVFDTCQTHTHPHPHPHINCTVYCVQTCIYMHTQYVRAISADRSTKRLIF
jgi:hypothetical protein